MVRYVERRGAEEGLGQVACGCRPSSGSGPCASSGRSPNGALSEGSMALLDRLTEDGQTKEVDGAKNLLLAS